ncbi:MAG: hypothetical protein AABX11_00400 [Nanoarchaeota archaeon]
MIDEKWMRHHKRRGGIIFTPRIAEQILIDFERYSPNSEALMIHCYAGISRSPAVAMALNAIFKLGQKRELERDYIGSRNTFVYDTIIRTRNGGRDINLS